MDVVRREVERDEELKHEGEAGVRRREEAEQTRRHAPVRDHVEDRAELGRLAERARGLAIDSVEEGRDAVRDRAEFRMRRHVRQRGGTEDHSRVPCGRETRPDMSDARRAGGERWGEESDAVTKLTD